MSSTRFHTFNAQAKAKLTPVLYACCIPVKGASRAVICDIQRQTYQLIPNSLYEILTDLKRKTLAEIYSAFDIQYGQIIEEYFDFLVERDYVFLTDHAELFPEIDLKWYESTPVTNGIIDINDDNLFDDWGNIFGQLGNLGCEHLQIRCFLQQPLAFFSNILGRIATKRIISIEIVTSFRPAWDKKMLFDFCQNHPRISSIIVFNAPFAKKLHISPQRMGNIIFTPHVINDASHCGKISEDFFVLNIKTFTESHHHNSCLNRKIAIDVEGNIKNCPSMPQSFGNIKDTTLAEALAHPDFKKYWNITKDQVKVCQDCEFRYICTDCRAYLEDPQDDYSKPLKCGYDPYTGEWAEWSTHPLKQRAIDYYGMREVVGGGK